MALIVKILLSEDQMHPFSDYNESNGFNDDNN